MLKYIRLIAPLLLALVTGCAGSRDVNVTSSTRDASAASSIASELVVGSYVKVELKTGEKFSGNVRDIEADAVTLDNPRNYSYKEKHVAFGEMAKLEVLEEPGGRSAGFSWSIGAVMIAGALLAVLSAGLRTLSIGD